LSDAVLEREPVAAAAVAPARVLGLVPDLSNEDYQASPGLSSSQLQDLARSPAHYWGLHRDPRRPPAPTRAGQLEGTLAHCALLEPDEFDARYVRLKPGDPARPTEAQIHAANRSAKTLDAIDFWRMLRAANPHALEFITPTQYEVAMRQADNLRALPEVAELLDAGSPEISAYWVDEETGVYCRCRPDWAHPAGDTGCVLLDVKTCEDATDEGFRWVIKRKGYFRQDAHYSRGFGAAARRTVHGFVFAAVESAWPYVARTHTIDGPSREQAEQENAALLRLYAKCERDGLWPGGRDPGINLINL
jgi:exodeoxyribonuclease VIII